MGVVDVRYAFSSESEKSGGCRHVSGRMIQDRELIVKTWKAGGRVYLCGSRGFADDVKRAVQSIVDWAGAAGEKDGAKYASGDFASRLRDALQERAASDIFD